MDETYTAYANAYSAAQGPLSLNLDLSNPTNVPTPGGVDYYYVKGGGPQGGLDYVQGPNGYLNGWPSPVAPPAPTTAAAAVAASQQAVAGTAPVPQFRAPAPQPPAQPAPQGLVKTEQKPSAPGLSTTEKALIGGGVFLVVAGVVVALASPGRKR